MQLDPDGAQHFPAAFSAAEVAAIRELFSPLRGSARLPPTPGLGDLVAPATAIARRFLPDAQPVFARWFDKSPQSNWSLGWHQDRTIAVAARADVPGFTQWTIKSGIHHCVPPSAIIERMLALRIHLDPTAEDNAPLLVAPASHALGAVAEREIPGIVERHGTHACLAAASDAWLYKAAILHASARAAAPARRRTLQIAWSPDPLPGGLQWLGI